MPKIYIKTLSEFVDISDEGKFELPSKEYTAAELKKIACEVNKSIRESKRLDFDYNTDEC